MSRPMDPATAAATSNDHITVGYFIRLDILTDPVIAWTGFGDITFGAGATGDAAMDGQTFAGITHLVGEISPIGDNESGSDAVEVRLPGIDPTDEALRQIVYNRNTWKFRQAWLWMALFDDTGAIIGKPFRLKTGRMDQMTIHESADNEGTVVVVIESQQAYAAESLNSRYSEQLEVDPSDTSQNYAWALANMTPAIGLPQGSSGTTSPSSPGGVGSGVHSGDPYNGKSYIN